MVTLETFTDDPDQVEHLIKWWVSCSKLRYHRVRVHGTVRDFINDVWLKLLMNFRDGKAVDCSLSTIIINQCAWELVSERKIGAEHTREARYRMRHYRPVCESDRIDETPHAGIFAQDSERDHAIAGVLCSIPMREAAVIRARYGLFGDAVMTLEQVGRALKRSRERVRQLETVGIKRMQHHTLASRLLPFVDEETHKRKTQDNIEQMKSSEYGQALVEELMKDF